MSDFNQAQNELDSFLDNQFSQQEPPAEQKAQADDADDNTDLNEYLAGEDPVDEEPAVPAKVNAEQPQTSVQSETDRILALERELAATRAREQMYQSAMQQQQLQQQQQVYQQEPQQPYMPFVDEELQLDPEYKANYEKDDPYISNVARRVANELYQRAVVPLQQELYNVQSQLNAQQDFNVQQSSFSQYTQLKNMFPDFDQMMNSAEWNSFLRQEDVYGTGAKMIDYVQHGIRTNNVKQLAGIVNQFKAQQARGKPQPQQVAPGRAQTTLPNTAASRGGKILKMSDFERATANFQAGRLSYDKYQVITDEFNAAMLEGRVNLNK